MAVSDARIRALVARLKAEGYESATLERLKAHLSVEEQQQALEAEIRHEMASALARTTARLDAAMLELELAERDLETAEAAHAEGASEAEAAAFEAAHAAFEAARRRALDARRDLQIHREAIGIRQAQVLHHRYPIPGPRRPPSR